MTTLEDDEIRLLNKRVANRLEPCNVFSRVSLCIWLITTVATFFILASNGVTVVSYIIFAFSSVFIFSIVIIVAWHLHRRYTDNNSVVTEYDTEHFNPILFQEYSKRVVDILSSDKCKEIQINNTGEYCRIGKCRIAIELPRFIESNIQSIKLSYGKFSVYFFPDCVIVVDDNSFYKMIKWESIKSAKAAFDAHIIIKRSVNVLLHGRIRNDGGYDQRYNTVVGRRVRKFREPLMNYNVFSVAIGGLIAFFEVETASQLKRMTRLFNVHTVLFGKADN